MVNPNQLERKASVLRFFMSNYRKYSYHTMMKYLFSALMNDGTTINQTQEDKSQTTEGKNAFYDVLQRLEEVTAFALYNQETQDEYLVDLRDGHFEVNQIQLNLHLEAIFNLRLIFFKRHVINFITREHYPVKFVFGFQANDEAGKNVQFTMTVS